MPSLGSPPQFPPPLQLEQPPTVNSLSAHIEEWIIYHFLRTLESNVHYENHLYGPMNVFLPEIFPQRRRYMNIPQALFRRVMREEEIGDSLSDVSLGSTGAFHESRRLPGREIGKQFPDFVIVKVTPQPDTRRDHFIVCVVEVKRNDDTELHAMQQMYDYMKRAAGLPSRVEDLCGYLVMGSKVWKYWLVDLGGLVDVVRTDELFDITDPDDQFTRELCEISIRNWNYQSQQ